MGGRPAAKSTAACRWRMRDEDRGARTIAQARGIVNDRALVAVVTAELARSVEFARELLEDQDLCSNLVLAEWLAAQREALDAALDAGDRDQLVAVLGLAFASPRGSA